MALTADCAITGWGYGTTANVPAGDGFTAIATGINSLPGDVATVRTPLSAAIDEDGAVHTWSGSAGAQVQTPPTGVKYTAVDVGRGYTLALDDQGGLTTWGNSLPGGTPTDAGYTAIAAGFFHASALRADGTINTWGYDVFQQQPSPAASGFNAIAAGGYHGLALNPIAAPTVTGTPEAAQVGAPYSYQFTVTGYPAPIVTVTDETKLSPGLTVSDGGLLAGTPTEAGTFTFDVTATNDEGTSVPLSVTVIVTEAAEVPDTGSLDLGSLFFGSGSGNGSS